MGKTSKFSQWYTALVKESGALTDEQKADIRTEAARRGLHINTRCNSCYRDVLVQIVVQERNEAQLERERKASKGQWMLREGLDVYFGGVRVNSDTLTDALAERLHAKGFPSHLMWRVGDETQD